MFAGTVVIGGGLLSYVAPSLRIFLRLQSVSLLLAVAVALAAFVGVLSPSALSLASELATCYLLCDVLAQQFLAPCSVRSSAAAWRRWCSNHHWTLVGFGLPVVALFRASGLHPFWCLALLEVTHVSAAALAQKLHFHWESGRETETD